MHRAIVMLLLVSSALAQSKPRARDLGVPFDGTPGPLNAITDVAGVEVGHTTLIRGEGKLQVGVGPVRTYALGAILLDLDDPTRVLGILDEPLMTVEPLDRDGYVPNVVYSCGALLHGSTVVLPYGCNDASIRFAFVDLPGLLARLTTP